MARQKPSVTDLQEREERAERLRVFLKTNLFSEIKLAETTGISRRTLQMIKAAKITPHPDTLRKLTTIFHRYEANKGR